MHLLLLNYYIVFQDKFLGNNALLSLQLSYYHA